MDLEKLESDLLRSYALFSILSRPQVRFKPNRRRKFQFIFE